MASAGIFGLRFHIPLPSPRLGIHRRRQVRWFLPGCTSGRCHSYRTGARPVLSFPTIGPTPPFFTPLRSFCGDAENDTKAQLSAAEKLPPAHASAIAAVVVLLDHELGPRLGRPAEHFHARLAPKIIKCKVLAALSDFRQRKLTCRKHDESGGRPSTRVAGCVVGIFFQTDRKPILCIG